MEMRLKEENIRSFSSVGRERLGWLGIGKTPCREMGFPSGSVVYDSLRSHGLYSPRNYPGQNTGMGSHWGSSQPGIKPRSPTLQADSLPAEPQRKPKNTGVGSLFLLQWISPTQDLNRGLLHCRWILYHWSHKGSPRILEWVAYPFYRGSS